MDQILGTGTNKSTSLKVRLKAADVNTTLEILAKVTELVTTTRLEKWKRDAETVLTQSKPKIGSKTRDAYQKLVLCICGNTERCAPALCKRARKFAADNGLDWKQA